MSEIPDYSLQFGVIEIFNTFTPNINELVSFQLMISCTFDL